jgi:hypothetical protein
MRRPKEERYIASGMGLPDVNDVKNAMRRSAAAKTEGNTAFAQRRREPAPEAYSRTIEIYDAMVAQRLDPDHTADTNKQITICYANRAAAWLLDGPGFDAQKALEDGRVAEKVDPSYAKA